MMQIHHAMKATSSVFPMKKVFIVSSVYQTAICVIHSKTVLMDKMKAIVPEVRIHITKEATFCCRLLCEKLQ